jgi:uncharacterized sulfatase
MIAFARLSAAVLAPWLLPLAAWAANVDRPNIVLIFIDDLGWADLGSYGNEYHETPNLDRLAAEGMRFTDAYTASPVCSSTRGCFMTGRYPARVGITDFIPGHWRPWERLVVPPIKNHLPLEETTFAEIVRELGYQRAYFGKWHLGGLEQYPDRQGFNRVLVASGGGHFGSRITGDQTLQLPDDVYLTDWLTDRAIEFVEANRNVPFLVMLSHYTVHIPLEARRESVEKFEAKGRQPGLARSHPTFAAMVYDMDAAVGRLLGKIDDLCLRESTLVIFTSDNGGLVRRYDQMGPIVSSQAPLRGEKGTVYEGGLRVPMIVRWPGVVETGRECNEPVFSGDVWPTVVTAAGMGVEPGMVDGVNLVPLFAGGQSLDREAIYFHYPHYHHMDPAGAVRAGDWKLIEHFDDGERELYNLRDDLGESTNLAEEEPQKAAALAQQLSAWRASVGARMPTENPDYDPARALLWRPR